MKDTKEEEEDTKEEELAGHLFSTELRFFLYQ